MYECPNCGSNVKYNIAAKMMKCDSCDSTFEPSYFDRQTTQSKQTEYFDTMVYTCPQCGGELIGDVNEAAVFCSYCGTSNILEAKMTQSKRPKYIIPFSKTKEDCKSEYSKFIKRAIFAPNELKKAEYIDGFRSIYMPYWSYEIRQKGNVWFNGKKEHRSGDYIITDLYRTSGNLDAAYEGYSMDAASSFDDSLSQAIAPFYYQQKQPFSPAYMSGYYADVADVEQGVYSRDAMLFATRETTKKVKDINEVDSSVIDTPNNPAQLNTEIADVTNCMYPVWFLSYRNKDRIAYAVVNGQTGKVAADVPIDVKKFALGAALMTIPLFLIYNMFFVFRPLTLVIIATIMSAICGVISNSSNTKIKNREQGKSDKGMANARKKAEHEKRMNPDLNSAKNTSKDSNLNMNIDGTHNKSDVYKSIFYHPAAYWFICLLAGIAIFFMSPVSDVPYYGLVLLNIVYMLYVLIITIRNYNRFATRQLPQFNRTGGDDNA